MNDRRYLRNKVRIDGTLTFETAFHIGSGKEGELSEKIGSGVILEPDGTPLLPGSTLKGNFRSLAEKLAGYFGYRTCLLDSTISNDECLSGLAGDQRKAKLDEFQKLQSQQSKLEWIMTNHCATCLLFGSPAHAARIFFSDGTLKHWSGVLEKRNGVCIDRDSETARDQMLFDLEVVPAGAEFDITIELENPTPEDLALVGAVIAEWESGFRIGGLTSRGLGRVRLRQKTIRQVDYKDPDQFKNYLLSHKMQEAENLLSDSLQTALYNQGGEHA